MRAIVRNRILDKYGRKCCYCGSTNNLEIDHIIPISKGGREDENNMQVLCRKCNATKYNTLNINLWLKFDEINDCVLIDKSIPLHSIKTHELTAAIELLFKYGNK